MRFETGPEDRGSRLDVFLTRFLNDLTRSQLQSLNRRGAILVDGQREKSGYRIRGGEKIDVDPPAPEPLTIEAENIPLDVLYEDPDLAIVDKPAGLVVHPGAGNRRSTLAHALLARFPELSDAGGANRPGIVHRLDKWTSGLIVVAKNNPAHHELSKSFERRQVRKTYTALVHGRVRQTSGAVDLPIGRHPAARTKMSARPGRGREARSEYRLVQSFKGFSLLEVRIQTGRTHQIRVHLNAIGYPVVGDDVYGEKVDVAFVRKWGSLGRYFLHASELEFPHPATGTRITFQSSLPEDLMSFLDRIRVSV